jgi:hypothetical protein
MAEGYLIKFRDPDGVERVTRPDATLAAAIRHARALERRGAVVLAISGPDGEEARWDQLEPLAETGDKLKPPIR